MAFPINVHPYSDPLSFFIFGLACYLYPSLSFSLYLSPYFPYVYIFKTNCMLTCSHHSCPIPLSGVVPLLQNAGSLVPTQLHILHIPQHPTQRLSSPQSLFPFMIFLSFITFYFWKCFSPLPPPTTTANFFWVHTTCLNPADTLHMFLLIEWIKIATICWGLFIYQALGWVHHIFISLDCLKSLTIPIL